MGFLMGGRPSVKWTGAGTNIIFDGNSLVSGVGSTVGQTVTVQLAALPPLNGNVAVANTGVGGRTIANMRTNGYQADAAYASGKKNVLIAWEGTNSIYADSLTGAAAGAQMAGYCADRLAVHSDYVIILVTTIARQAVGSWGSIAAANAQLSAYDAYLKANYKAMGAKMVVDLRLPGSPFVLPDYSSGSFENPPYINYEAAGEVTAHIHLNNLGYGAAAQIIATALRRLPAR